MTSEEDYKKSLEQERTEMCNTIEAKHGVIFDQNQLQVNKVSYGFIQIVMIKVHLTFRI